VPWRAARAARLRDIGSLVAYGSIFLLPEKPMPKISVSLTDEHARVVEEAVASGDYGSSSEVIREALRDWRTKRALGRLWDEGLASGPADLDETIDDIKRAARQPQG
jgi:antitoxin ParD1/3/4